MRLRIANLVLDGSVSDYALDLGAYGSSSQINVTLTHSPQLKQELDRLSLSVGGLLSRKVETKSTDAAPTNTIPTEKLPQVSSTPAPTEKFPSYPTPSDENQRILGIVRECLRQGVTDNNSIAYILATVKHECGNINGWYAPVAEIGGPGLRYAPYYGRGLVQLTWKFNYERFQKITGLPLVSEPNRVIEDFGLSCFVLVYGSKNGTFTGKKLSDYFGGGRADFINARRIINGTDRASLIAGYAREWLTRLPRFLSAANNNTTLSTTPTQPPTQPTTTPNTTATIEMSVELNDRQWLFDYQGYDTDGYTLRLRGKGISYSGDFPTYIETISLKGLASLLGVSVTIDRDITLSQLTVQRGSLLKYLTKVAYDYGYVVSTEGKSLSIKTLDKVQKVDIPEVVTYTLSDTPVDGLGSTNGVAVAYPGTLEILQDTRVNPGAVVTSPYLPSEKLWVITRVTHNPVTTRLSIGSPLVSNNVTAASQQQQQQQQTAPTAPQPVSGNSTAQKMLQSAISNRGKDSSISGLNGGRLACAWAINRFVLEPVFGRKFGSLPNLVVSVEADMKASGFKQVAASEALPGYIAIAERKDGSGAHIGVVIRQEADPWTLSNSSSRAAFVSEYNWERIMGKTYAPARFAYYAPPDL